MAMQTVVPAKTNFMDIAGVDKLDILWMNRVFGTPFMAHPVTTKRVVDILEKIEAATAAQVCHRYRAF